MRIGRVLAAFGLVAGMLVATPGISSADHCSGISRPYQGRGSTQPVDWVTLQYGSAEDPFVGAYYTDGYAFVDGSGDRIVVRVFVPWWPGYVDVRVTVDPSKAEPVAACQHVREP